MTSAENSILEPPNLKFFWGRITTDPPKRHSPSALAIMPPVGKNQATALQQKSHWDKTNRKTYIILNGISFVCLVAVWLFLSSMATFGHILVSRCSVMLCS